MSRRPKYTQSDSNQAQLVRQLRRLGFHVAITSHLPVRYGVLDIFVCGEHLGLRAWVCYPFEVKPPGKQDDLNANEQRLLRRLKEPGLVVTQVEDVLKKFARIDDS